MGQDALVENKSTIFSAPPALTSSSIAPGHSSASVHPQHPLRFSKDLDVGRFVGPHSQADLVSFPRPFQAFPLSIVPKKTTSSKIINVLSFPAGCTILLDGDPDTEVAAFDVKSANHLTLARASPQITASKLNCQAKREPDYVPQTQVEGACTSRITFSNILDIKGWGSRE